MARRVPFSVVFATGEEVDYPSSELNSHGPTVHGWRSHPDTTLTPQEVVLRFQAPAKVCRIQVLAHQYFIPERIELWIHYSPKGAATTPSSQTFEYLGFISLSDNSSTKYKSRELQSVAVGPRNGTHLKLRMGPAQPNHLNPNKQIALIAVNVIGLEIASEMDKTDSGKPGEDVEHILLVSICDDLSFSMYVEEAITETVRELEAKKSMAVNDERFEYARKLKLCMTALRSAGERLGRYALAKRQAVQQEDFITAKLRKEQIEIYRKLVFDQLQVEKLLERDGFIAENDLVSDVYAQKPVLPSPPSLQDVAATITTESTFLSPKTAQKETNSCSIDNLSLSEPHSKTPSSPMLGTLGRSPKRGSPTTSTGSLRRRNKSAPRNSYEDYEERAVPALRHSHTNEFLRECQGAAILENDPCRGRSRLNERERRQAALPILVFGNDMVELFYSRQFQDREDGLTRLCTVLTGEESQNFSVGINKIARSSTLLLHRAVRDAVYSVFSHATETVRALFVDFVPGRVSHSEVARCVDRLLPELLAKCGDPSPRIHTLAQHTILSIAACPEVREQHLVAPALSRSVGSGTHPRLALSRMQMVEQLVLSQGISTDKQSGLTCRALSECGCSGIHHPAEPVRKVAERVLVLVYKINPRLVRKQLPPDDDITRRNLLYRQLFTEFDKLDAQRRREMQEANRAAAASANNSGAVDTFSPPLSASSSLATGKVCSPPLSSAAEHRQKSVKYESRSRFGFNGTKGVGNGGGGASDSSNGHSSGGSPVKRILKSKSGHCITITNEDDTVKEEASKISASSQSVLLCNGGKQEYNELLKQAIHSESSRKSSNADSVEEQQDSLGSNCPFCDWSFVGDVGQLDKHFWKACPILTKCPQCSQVLEVSALNLHLANECEAKISYVLCERCTEAVHKDLLELHLMEDYCKEVIPNTVRCPLCHSDVAKPLDGGWKVHLLSTGGCPGNSRRRSKI